MGARFIICPAVYAADIPAFIKQLALNGFCRVLTSIFLASL
jgi:hypothetical protein